MRRMYSEQELTKVIGEVLDNKIEDGDFNEVLAGLVDDYLEENPVDITALNGKTITPAIVNASTSMSAPSIDGDAITGDSIIETMTGYSFAKYSETTGLTREFVYAGIVKNGNKLTIAIGVNFTRTDELTGSESVRFGYFSVPSAVASKIIPTSVGGQDVVDIKLSAIWKSQNDAPVEARVFCTKASTNIIVSSSDATAFNTLQLNTKYYCRYELTILLKDNMAS